jgi:nucleoid-associated protein YgaU
VKSPLTRRPFQGATGEEVEMKMRDGLAPIFSVVDDHPKSVFGVTLLSGDFTDFEHEMAEKALVTGFGEGDPGEGFLGNEKEVNGGLRGEIRTFLDVAEVDGLGTRAVQKADFLVEDTEESLL